MQRVMGLTSMRIPNKYFVIVMTMIDEKGLLR